MKYAYINGKILDGTKDMQVKEGFVILTDNDKIEDIVKAGTDLNGYEKVDLKRRYIMPGLINMHVHLAGNGKPQKKQRDNEKLVKILMGNALMRSIAYGMVAGFAKTELMSGVTTIRTVGGLGSFDTKLRDEINAGTKMGPRILAANEGISVPGGHMAGSVAVAADSIDTALKHLEQTQYSKTFDKIPAPDIAISMGCDVGCPYIGRAFDDNWGLQDPTGQSDEVFIEIIKEIENRISQL